MSDNNRGVESLGEALPKQCARVREIIAEYRALPSGAGLLAASLMEQDLMKADQAMIQGDLVAMIRVYETLKEYDL